MRISLTLCVFLLLASYAQAAPPSDQPLDILVPDETIVVPPELTFRARVAAMEQRLETTMSAMGNDTVASAEAR